MSDERDTDDVTYNNDGRFDLKLSQALIDEKRLGDIFRHAKIERIELKTEYSRWEETGNLAIEFARDGKPSGIAVTEADYWVQELVKEGFSIGYFMFPVARLKEKCRELRRQRRFSLRGGDGGRTSNILLEISELIR